MAEKIRAVVVDDERKSREVMKILLHEYAPDIDVTGEAASVEEAYDVICRLSPALVFLDIQMTDGNGFELLKKFDPVPFRVIFVTSYNQYALDAIKFEALDYLLKPVDIQDLKTAVDRAAKSIRSIADASMNMIRIVEETGTEPRKKIAVHNGDKVRILNEQNIVYIEADGRYCHLFTESDENYTTAKYLKDFEEYLAKRNAFVRINKRHLLNINHIRHYTKGEPCVIEMSNGKIFEVSRRKKQEVLELLRQ